MEDERGDGDAIEDAGGGGAVVVVVGAGEAGVEGGDAVVELAQGADAGGAVGVVGAGEERGLAAEAAEEGAEEFELVEAVMGRWSASAEGPRSTAGETPMTEWRWVRRSSAEVAGEFEDEIAAHGVADERDGLEAVLSDEEVAHDGEDVAGEAGVIEGGGEVLGAAAVAHVHADDVAAGAPELVGVADDVLRVR